ncbi:MAG: flagellar hook-length control protein FliK, partial [Burkholderiales bacterium]|nr:flagellar hook-length control protein FliK [Burkholderiales bacterium]
TGPVIGTGAAAGSARPSPSPERTALPEPVTDKQAPPADHEANFAAGGKTLSFPAAAGDEMPHPGSAEATRPRSTDTAPPIQTNVLANVLTTMPGHSPAPVGSTPGQELKLVPHVGAKGWDDALAQKVVWLVSERQQVAELHLNPPHLGPLEVRVSVAPDQNGIANAQFASPHAAVREAIEAAMPRLREILAESGITLGNTTVGNDSFRQQQGFTPADGAPAPRHEAGSAGASSRVSTIVAVAPNTRNGLVDIFA